VSYPALLVDVAIFVLSLWVGFEVISKVPATLHTPLMSAANSIHGIVLAGAMLIAVTAHNAVGYVIAFLAAAFAAMNVVGGYVVTGRMLKMFRRRPAVQPGTAVQAGSGPDTITAASNGPASSGSAANGRAPGSGAAAANGSSRTGQTV
jgi:H+-translocating NAD(P) transhydrogenase subunit alpha